MLYLSVIYMYWRLRYTDLAFSLAFFFMYMYFRVYLECIRYFCYNTHLVKFTCIWNIMTLSLASLLSFSLFSLITFLAWPLTSFPVFRIYLLSQMIHMCVGYTDSLPHLSYLNRLFSSLAHYFLFLLISIPMYFKMYLT